MNDITGYTIAHFVFLCLFCLFAPYVPKNASYTDYEHNSGTAWGMKRMNDHGSKLVLPFKDGWKWVHRNTPHGTVERHGKLAYFKSVCSPDRGVPPFSGFELLAYQLARHLKLLTPAYFWGTLRDGTKGVGSYMVPPPVCVWGKLPDNLSGEQLMAKFRDPSWFAGVLVFDVFIGNTDRSSGNLLCRTKPNRPWDLFLIDHNNMFDLAQWITDGYRHKHSLNIMSFVVPSNHKLCDIYQIVLKKHPDALERYIRRVERISNRDIREMVKQIPSDFLPAEYTQQAKRILCARRDAIRTMFHDYL